PPGSFGAADVVAIAPDGIWQSTAPSLVGYGLPYAGEVRAEGTYPQSLVADPNVPLMVYASAGGAGSGNVVDQAYLGSITNGGTVTTSQRVASFDVSA